MIATPDQRVRVFVSSTLEELAPERVAAREAIEGLRLIPVLFELGARPHPPRSLYQAYVEQSDIFVGIYGERYGWVAPGMEISGLEDEYRLAAEKPRLLYVKRPAANRESRMRGFLDRIDEESDVSYQPFSNADQLRELLANDLALLLSERFQAAPHFPPPRRLPAPLDRFVNRDIELEELERLLLSRSARLITVTGPGGVGKSRLALEAARRAEPAFAAGARLVDLSSIVHAELVTAAIQAALDIGGTAPSPSEALVEALGDVDLLLVLDNFEQVLPAAASIQRLLEKCPGITALVTSRSVLAIKGERQIRLLPLGSDAVTLFVDRAQAVNPAFALTAANATLIAEICRRLDGIPLAVELAAVQLRAFPPETILEWLERRIPMVGAAYPERQRTLNATLDWSYELLDDAERAAFAQASVFRGGWTLDALEAVAGARSVELVSSLVEKSLVIPTPQDADPRFALLPTIQDYAADKLEASDGGNGARSRHAAFYLDLVEHVGRRLQATAHAAGIARLQSEEPNVRAAVQWTLERGNAAAVADAAWWLLPYWSVRERFEEGRRWLQEVLALGGLPERAHARALAAAGILALWAADEPPVAELQEAQRMFDALGDQVGLALAQLPLGVLETLSGDGEAGLRLLEKSLQSFEGAGHEWGVAMTMFARNWALNATHADAPLELFEAAVARAQSLGDETATLALGMLAQRRAIRGEHAEAKRALADVLRRTRAQKSTVGVSLYLDLVADLAVEEGEHRLATRLSAAADSFEARRPLLLPFARERETRRAALRERLGASAFTTEWEVGRARELDESTAEALEWTRSD